VSEREHGVNPPLSWAVAWQAIAGESVSGDTYVVAPIPGGTLVAAMDGLGHGPDAAVASQAAAEVVREHADEPVRELLQRCHRALRRTRGVAMSLVAVRADPPAMEWIGVGNVEARVLRSGESEDRGADESILLRGGVVGYQVPDLRPSAIPLGPGDTLLMATDGVEPGFADEVDRAAPVADLAVALLEGHGKETDDGLVLAARFEGASP
jgi:phosphoserine phosphatase RsbX